VAGPAYFAAIARRTQNTAPALAPPHILMRGWEGNWPAEFAPDAAAAPDVTAPARPAKRPAPWEPATTMEQLAPVDASAPPGADAPKFISRSVRSAPRIRPAAPIARVTDRPDSALVADPAPPNIPRETSASILKETQASLAPIGVPATTAPPRPSQPDAQRSKPAPPKATSAATPPGLVDSASQVSVNPPPEATLDRPNRDTRAAPREISPSPLRFASAPDTNLALERSTPTAGSPGRQRRAHHINAFTESDRLRPAVRAAAPSNPGVIRPPAAQSPRPALSPVFAPSLRAAFEWVVQPSAKARTDTLPIENRERPTVAPPSATPDAPVVPNTRTVPASASAPEPDVSARRPPAGDHRREIHIGSIEVRIESPLPRDTPFTPQSPAPMASPELSPAGRGFARGFTTPLGLRQG
jgi:hypothetical protein